MFPFYADAVGLYFMKSITAYQTTLGPEDYETLTTVEEFCTTFKVRRGGGEEIHLLQGKEQQLHFAGAAMKYPTSKVRETQVRP